MALAVTYSRAGDPADVLEISEISDPPPPGHGEIQVQVTAFPIHPGDLRIIGATPPSAGEPNRAGLEATGTVRGVGPGVTSPLPGTRVTFFPNPGSWAQVVNVPADLAVTVPDSLSDEVAAQLVCNPVTALMLRRAAQEHFSVGFNGVVVNNAAASSVGRLFAADAQDHQIATVNVVRSTQRAHQMGEEFPAVPVISTDTKDWPDKVRRAAAGRPIAAVLDPVGGQLAAELFSLLAPSGTLITYGQMASENIPLHASALQSGSGLRGLTIGRWVTDSSPQRRASDLASAVAMMQAHQQLSAPAATYPLDQIRAAAQHVSAPGKVGTVVVVAIPLRH
jgi:NADPH:quinone reductase-like Zn-dependent oxidoreductase